MDSSDEIAREIILQSYIYFSWLSRAIFFSTDYFSVIPWIFLFITGYYIYQFMKQKEWNCYLIKEKWRWLEWIGQHSLVVYMIHQPAIIGCITLFGNLKRIGLRI